MVLIFKAIRVILEILCRLPLVLRQEKARVLLDEKGGGAIYPDREAPMKERMTNYDKAFVFLWSCVSSCLAGITIA